MLVEYQLANLFIFAAYMALPAVLIRFRGATVAIVADPAFRGWFAAFIFACGVGHLEGVISFFWTQYHLFAQWHLLTAIVSWMTLARLIRVGVKHG